MGWVDLDDEGVLADEHVGLGIEEEYLENLGFAVGNCWSDAVVGKRFVFLFLEGVLIEFLLIESLVGCYRSILWEWDLNLSNVDDQRIILCWYLSIRLHIIIIVFVLNNVGRPIPDLIIGMRLTRFQPSLNKIFLIISINNLSNVLHFTIRLAVEYRIWIMVTLNFVEFYVIDFNVRPTRSLIHSFKGPLRSPQLRYYSPSQRLQALSKRHRKIDEPDPELIHLPQKPREYFPIRSPRNVGVKPSPIDQPQEKANRRLLKAELHPWRSEKKNSAYQCLQHWRTNILTQ